MFSNLMPVSYVLGRQANLKELLKSKELATWGYKY